jgi:hypothetical protein
MPDSPLPPLGPPASEPDTRPTRIRCEFCRCQLAPNGDVMAMSAEARVYRDQAEEIDRLKAALAQAEGASETIKRDADALRAQLAQLTAPAPVARSAGWPG